MIVAKKQIISTADVDLDITGVTLLSIEEYEASEDDIPVVYYDWWLRSPGYFDDCAACVCGHGDVDDDGYNVNNGELGVRPALVISNLKSVDLKKSDTFKLADHDWTVINEDMALCNDIIAKHCFRENWEASDTNDYEASDVKKYLEQWAADNHILAVPDKENDNFWAENSNELTERERKVMRLALGLEDGCPHSIWEIGEMFNVTSERIRQIEVHAEKKLRKKNAAE